MHKGARRSLRHGARQRLQLAGFTIVELLIVIVVIGILATITVVAYNGIQQRAWQAVLASDLRGAANQLLIDQAMTGSFPETQEEADGGRGLRASPGTTYQYTPDNASDPQTFCLTGTNNNIDYKVTESESPSPGVCDGDIASGAGGGAGGAICDDGFIPVPGSSTYGTSDFCVAKYEAKDNGSGTAVSVPGGTPWVSISQVNAMTEANAACSGCHLITEAEWLTIAQNVMGVGSNWSGGTVGSGYLYQGHSDNGPANSLAASNDGDNYSGTGQTSGSQRRTLTLSNGEIIWDLTGNVWEWTTGQTTGGQPGNAGESSFSWKEWNAVEGTGSLSPDPFPSAADPAAGAWTSVQGIGKLYSNTGDNTLRGFRRGDYWYNSGNPGVFSLNLSNSPYGSYNFVGFRMAK